MKKLILPDKVESLWTATTPATDFPVLRDKIETDIIIIGGGIAGINAAYFLKRAGLKVVVIESTYIAMGTSGNTTAKVTSQHKLRYSFIKNKFGKEKARKYADSNQWAITELEKIITQEKIACDFYRLPAYTYARSKKALEAVKKEVAVSKELNLPASFTESVNSIPFKIMGAIRFDDQAYFHPRKFLLPMADKINSDGSYIFEKTECLDIHEGKDICEVITDKGNIKAKYVIVATNFPFYDKAGVFSGLFQTRSYVFAVKLNTKIPEGMFIGPEEGDLSFRPHKSGKEEWMTLGGIHQSPGKEDDAKKGYRKLKKAGSEMFDIQKIGYKWAAQDTMSLDKIPYIGYMPDSKRVFVTTGYGAWGITTSLVSAKLLTDLILGIKNEWNDLYDPARLNQKN